MYHLGYDSLKKRLQVVIIGELTEEESTDYKNSILNILDGLAPGFTVLADLSEAAPSVLRKSAGFQYIRDYAASKGMRKAATIISEEVKNGENTGAFNNFFTSKAAAISYLDQ